GGEVEPVTAATGSGNWTPRHHPVGRRAENLEEPAPVHLALLGRRDPDPLAGQGAGDEEPPALPGGHALPVRRETLDLDLDRGPLARRARSGPCLPVPHGKCPARHGGPLRGERGARAPPRTDLGSDPARATPI